MKTLRINSRDLAYTIDTYGMFTGESVEESESEYYRDEFKLTDDEWRDLEFNYNHAGIVKALADASVNILWNELKGAIVHDIKVDESGSPQFYNYTTDHYTASWTIDDQQLEAYIRNTEAEFKSFVSENWDYEYSKAVTEGDEDTQLVVALDFWSRQILDPEDYESQMFEVEFEAYSENMELTPESDDLIRRKQAERDERENQTELAV